MSPNRKLTPNLDQESTKQINLTVLQRTDLSIEEILITAAHVTLYNFDIDRTEWSRKDVEGSLFVVKRNTQPRFQFIVMNQRNTDNLVENLLGDFEFEVQVPYLLYRNAAQEVNGIWFYKSQDCEVVASLFSRIINTYSQISTNIEVSSTKSVLEESAKIPAIAVMEGPLESIASETSAIKHVPKDSFVNFCSATNAGNSPHSTNQTQMHQPFPVSIPLLSQSPNLLATPVPRMQSPATVTISSTQSLPLPDTSDKSIINRSTNLVSPSVFLRPPPSSTLMMPPNPSKPIAPLHSPAILQRPYGAPLLQPFPPPAPPFALTPTAPKNVPHITREKVRDILMKLVQNPQFTDMFYEELLKGVS